VATKVASVFAEIGADTSGLVKGVQNAMRNLKDLGKYFQDLTGVSAKAALGFAAAGAAIYQVGKFVNDSVKEAHTYNLAMVDMARIMGTTTEEASKLVQVGDDLRVSQESIATALKFAAKNGIEPTIAGLAKASDQYNSFSTQTEKAAWASQNFGRNWDQIAKVLEVGGTKLKEMSNAIEDGLIVTEESARASTRYFQQVDRLTDSWTAFKMEVGKGVIPTLANLMEAINRAGYSVGGYKTLIEYSKVKLEQHAIASGYAAEETGFLANAINSVAVPAITSEYDALVLASGATSKLTTEFIFNKAAAALDAKSALQLAIQMGVLDENSIAASQAISSATDMLNAGKITAKEYTDMVKGINQQLKLLEGKNGLTVQMYVDVWYRSHGVVPSGQTNSTYQASGNTGTTAVPRATGANFTVPAGYQGDNYPILAKTGERVNIKPAGQPEVGMNELLAAIKRLPSQIGVSVRDAVLTS
jgi:hypothetical protein